MQLLHGSLIASGLSCLYYKLANRKQYFKMELQFPPPSCYIIFHRSVLECADGLNWLVMEFNWRVLWELGFQLFLVSQEFVVFGHASPQRDKVWNNQRVVKLFSEIGSKDCFYLFALQTSWMLQNKKKLKACSSNCLRIKSENALK